MKKQVEDTEYGESLPPPLCLEGATDPVLRHASSLIPGLLGLRARNLGPQHSIPDFIQKQRFPALTLKVRRDAGWLTSHFLRRVICRPQVAHILATSEVIEDITRRLR